jgi:hypothetical protein
MQSFEFRLSYEKAQRSFDCTCTVKTAVRFDLLQGKSAEISDSLLANTTTLYMTHGYRMQQSNLTIPLKENRNCNIESILILES